MRAGGKSRPQCQKALQQLYETGKQLLTADDAHDASCSGYDASCHLAEETAHASRSAPIGVLTSVSVSVVFGFFLICSLLFSIQDFDNTVASPIGQPVYQILIGMSRSL